MSKELLSQCLRLLQSKGWKELGLAKNTVLRNYRDWIDKSTKLFYGAFWTCHKTAHKWKTCTLYTFNSPCPLHCIYTLSHKSWSMSVIAHNVADWSAEGNFWKLLHPRTENIHELIVLGKTHLSINPALDPLAFQLTPKHNHIATLSIMLWFCCDTSHLPGKVIQHIWIGFQRHLSPPKGFPKKNVALHSPSSHSWDAQWTFRIRSMSTSMAWRKITHDAALNLTTPKRCLQLQVATSVKTFATARYAPFWWDVFLIQLLSVFWFNL